MTAHRCPYCTATARSPKGFRDHVVRRCRNAPPEARLAVVVQYADSYTEKEWSSLVVARFRDAGWLCFHAERGRGRDGDWLTNTGDDGLPDWLFVKRPMALFVELKKQKGSKPTEEQVRVIAELQACAQLAAFFARPADFPRLMRLCDGAHPV